MSTNWAMAPHVERILRISAQQPFRAEHLEPFVAAARDVLEQELSAAVTPGRLAIVSERGTSQDVTAIVGIAGGLTGLALYGMSRATSLAVVGRLLGEAVDELDELALSGIGELGNVITGRAATLLAESGLSAEIAPPVLLVGAGSRI